MPLIDLRSSLTDLRFGNDRPGYGSSGLPYIQTRIPDIINSTGNTNPIFKPGTTGNLDYPIRGGSVNFSIGSQTFTLSSQIDKTRIRKFFEDAPRGTAFIQKQIGLQLSNPKIETGNSLYGLGQATPLPGLLENTRIYNNGVNTLAQVGVQGTGLHAQRHGTLPFNPLQKSYYDIVNAQNINNNESTNRLLILNSLKMVSANSPIVPIQNINDASLVSTLGISYNRNILFQYLGGPGSVYGIGSTTINRVVDTTRVRSTRVMAYDQLRQQDINDASNLNEYGLPQRGTKIQDFRTQLNEYDPPNNWLREDSIDYKFYVNKKDKLNKLYPFVFKNDQAPWEVVPQDKNTSTDDLIKFVFECISNDNPSYSTALFFRAFLTAGITDNNSAQLNAFKYMGRGENFYTYQGFERNIAFSFRVAAGSKEELRPMYNRVNALISQVYPDYSPTTNIMRAPVVRVTIGDYLYRMPGFLESVNVTVDNNYPWEVNLEEVNDLAQLPQVLDISVSFRPIMDILPQRTVAKSYNTSTSVNSSLVRNTTTIYNQATPLIVNNSENIENPNNFINPEPGESISFNRLSSQ